MFSVKLLTHQISYFILLFALTLFSTTAAFADTGTNSNSTSSCSTEPASSSENSEAETEGTETASTSTKCPACECTPCKENDDSEKPKNFTGSVQLGAIMSTGDTEEFTENGAFNFKYLRNKMTYTGLLSALYNYSRTDDDHNERYQGQGQAQYAFTEKNYWFVNTNFIADSSDDYDYIWENQIGYGRRLINSEKYHMTLDAQAGPGYRIAPTSDSEVKDEQETLNGSVIYNWQITKATSFNETISTSYAESDTITTLKTSLTTNLYKSLGLQFASTIVNHSNSAGDTHKTNSYNTINLIYGF